MKLLSKINKIIDTTEDRFHDSSLEEININFGKERIEILIEHARYNKKVDSEILYFSKFIFLISKTINIIFDYNEECPLYGYNEINEFYCSEIEKSILVTINGIHGWKISFISNDFEYFEKRI